MDDWARPLTDDDHQAVLKPQDLGRLLMLLMPPACSR
jgi:hypothetical protein